MNAVLCLKCGDLAGTYNSKNSAEFTNIIDALKLNNKKEMMTMQVENIH